MKIKTAILKKAVSTIIKGASNNYLLPITSLLSIKLENKQLTLITTDGTNQFKIKLLIEDADIVNEENFYTVVTADVFAKLVEKTSKEFIELNINDNYLQFIGNGKYKLDIAINEDGNVIKFKDVSNIKFDAEFGVNLKDLQEAIKTAKASRLKEENNQILSGYYVGDGVIATDRQLICKVEIKILDNPILLSNELANLLLLIDSNLDCVLNVNQDGYLLFSIDNYEIFGKQLSGKNTFENSVVPIINNLLNLNYSGVIQINKVHLLEVLDRINLFIGPLDDNIVKLSFKQDERKLLVESLQTNAEEEVLFLDSADEQIIDFSCFVNIDMLKKQLKSIASDIIYIKYGDKQSIQINTENIILCIALSIN